jgi:CarD family transcriptional regulator
MGDKQTAVSNTKTPMAEKPTKTAKPKPATSKKVTTAASKSAAPPADAKPAAKAAAKPAAKPAAKTAAPKTAAPKTPKPAPAPAQVEPPAPPPPEPEAAAPAPKPAPAPISHSGVPAGPMRPQTPPRAMAKAETFVDGDFVVYPTHGVGKVERIATEEIAGHTLELIHITFDENRMTLRVPTNKARTAGLRKLASKKQFDDVLATLKGRARIKRTMWSRRAQEYEAKINSGDPSAIAEVVRDLHRNAGQPDQSFSERQIYESALDRLAAEYGALEQVDKATATERLIAHLKSE